MLNSLTDERAEALRSCLPQDRFAAADDAHLREPRGRYAGQAGLLARPRSTEEVATLVRAASDMRVPVIPYGGGTGLVGGQVAEAGPIPLILSLEKMNAIRAVHPEENVLIADAGVILADVQAAAEQANRLFPLSLAAEGSARIGGNLSTNAGGTGVLRYGNARDLCLGVEAVLPSGEVFNGLSRLRKDNTGYDLRHLLIGAEGTLGIITAAALKLFPRPSATGTALMQVTSPAAALSLLALARDHVGDSISAFELIGAQGFAFLAETMPQVRNPWTETPEWCVLIELGMNGAQDPKDALETVFAAATEAGLVQDGMIAQNAQQGTDFWSIRENIPEANRRIGSVSSHDISVPLGALSDFIAEGNKRIAALGDFRINCFGHVGDGNLHYNVFPIPGKSRADHDVERPKIKRVVHDLVHEMGGSVSAEHGVGRLKVEDMERYADPTKLAAMRAIKTALDPHGIMNPGAVLRQPGG
ncbi:FAD-binding oxidoreductase [Tateyamaria sp. ANG-S1]|uniref:FAD-binding oxidoreductase n=1 Tax=Tateyamaria sp. ANG-S1 TaxID=1577905 RepID=UPI00057DF295|nr:FAD-binding oxidoreductase [Tateyamaria sp. ANG-S1]KIC51153.1 2-hydroxyacid dehydrogenase [Tateyamaria sp. ANG-S1]